MEELKRRILEEGRVIEPDILKVDSFINHQIDVGLLDNVALFFKNHFPNVTKVVTIEASGIAVGSSVARIYGNCPLVFAKKAKSVVNVDTVYQTKVFSFTKKVESMVFIDKKFLSSDDKILIVDDFLAQGAAALGLLDLCKQAKAEVVGVCVVVEKGFQKGRDRLESNGIKVISGACIKEFKNGQVILK